MRLKIDVAVAVLIPTLLLMVTQVSAQRQAEHPDRGLVALYQGHGKVYIGWRLLATDPDNIAFNVYRSTGGGEAVKLNDSPIAQSTNFVDATASLDHATAWWVRPVLNGREQEARGRAELPADPPERQYKSIRLRGNYTANKVGIADLDGDGVYDLIVKQPGRSIDPGRPRRSPGTYKIEAYNGRTGRFMWSFDLGWNIVQGVWFSPAVVYDLDGDGKAEVALKTAPYAATPEQAFISGNGFILDGPEYCSVLDGLTGTEIDKVDWIGRGRITDWGDDRGNRVNRNLIGVAHLDGKRPSLLVLRGTYTLMKIDAYNYVDKKLTKVWSWFGDDESPRVRGQGAHTLHAFDVDDDGRDEIIIGAACLDDDGKCLWNMGMGHPDWYYLADVDPARAGLEIAYGFETRQSKNGICLADPRTGEILWGCDHPTSHIHDWGMVADIDPDHPGMEVYGMERDGRTCYLYSARGELLARNEDLGSHGPRSFYWLDGPIKVRTPFSYRRRTLPILKYKGDQIGEIHGQIVGLADCLGDWREELITAVEGEVRIHTTTIPATTRRVCLMQDPLYRSDVAMQMMGYLYPPQLSRPLGVAGDREGVAQEQ